VGLFDRLGGKFKAGLAGALAPAPDPRTTYVSAYQKQRALLEQVAAANRELSAAKQRLQAKAAEFRASLPALEERARTELQAGRRDGARLALQRRQVVVLELATLERQLNEVEREEADLSLIEQRLSTQVEALRARQEVIEARYQAAEAQVRINEAMSGVSAEFADLSAALRRAEETTGSLQARATAIDQLVREGSLESLALPSAAHDALALPLLSGADEEIESQLAALEHEVGAVWTE